MTRRLVFAIGLTGAASCGRPPAPPTLPTPAVSVPATSAGPTPFVEAPAPATPSRAAPVHVATGWVRDPGDPAAPLLQVSRLDREGPGSDATVSAILGEVDALLACWETAVEASADAVARIAIRLRAPPSPGDDPLEITTRAPDPLRRCIDDTVRRVVPAPRAGDWVAVDLSLYPRREDAVLRRSDPAAIVSVREAETCWQLEQYPCAPNKHCRAAEWIRTDCGDPAMRDDVQLRLGLGPPEADGRAAPVDVRLVDPRGGVLWLTPLAPDLRDRYGARFVADEGPAVDISRYRSTFAVTMDPDAVMLADVAGVQVFDRRDGNVKLAWASPESAEPKIWFDDGRYEVHRGGRTCEGDAGHGQFFAACRDRWVWFDGHSMAVFDPVSLRARGHARLGQRGATLAGNGLAPRASLTAGGVRLDVSGQVYVQ